MYSFNSIENLVGISAGPWVIKRFLDLCAHDLIYDFFFAVQCSQSSTQNFAGRIVCSGFQSRIDAALLITQRNRYRPTASHIQFPCKYSA